MVMLSELRQFEVIDDSGRREKLADLEVALLEADYPPVTHLLFLKDCKLQRLEWSTVRAFERNNKRIIVGDLSLAKVTSYEELSGHVLLKHDILDALIIDLLNRSSTRASDLQLDEADKGLRLTAADAGFGAMLRRISRGLYTHVNKDAIHDWKYVEFLRGEPKAVRSCSGYRLRIARLSAGEIARLADYVPYLHAAELVMLLPDPKAADVLEAMPPERRLQVFEELDDDQAVKLLTLMSPDLAADLAARLHLTTMQKYLRQMPKKQSGRIIELLRYPEDTVGGVMINDIISLPSDMTISVAKERLQEPLKDLDFISLIFVVEDENSRKLRGVLSLRNFLAADDNQILEELMDPYVMTLSPYDPAVKAARRIVDNQLPAMPVTGPEGDLLGTMTANAAVRQLVPPMSDLQTLKGF